MGANRQNSKSARCRGVEGASVNNLHKYIDIIAVDDMPTRLQPGKPMSGV
jgi:hypothetical protein